MRRSHRRRSPQEAPARPTSCARQCARPRTRGRSRRGPRSCPAIGFEFDRTGLERAWRLRPGEARAPVVDEPVQRRQRVIDVHRVAHREFGDRVRLRLRAQAEAVPVHAHPARQPPRTRVEVAAGDHVGGRPNPPMVPAANDMRTTRRGRPPHPTSRRPGPGHPSRRPWRGGSSRSLLPRARGEARGPGPRERGRRGRAVRGRAARSPIRSPTAASSATSRPRTSTA